MIWEISPVVIAASLTAFFGALFIIGVLTYSKRQFGKIGARVRRAGERKDVTQKSLFRQAEFSSIEWLDTFLKKVPIGFSIQRLLLQADIQLNPAVFLSLCIGAPVITYLILHGVIHAPFMATSIFVIGVGVLPWLWVKIKKKLRMAKFLKQLPDALDGLARALRAGHGISSGFNLLAEEYDKPLGQEFEKTLQEINYGIGLEKALKNLMERVDLPSLRFFAISVIIQREVGGNLAELVETIAHLIREHYKFLGRVRVLSAEARISAIILSILPVGIGLVIFYLNPEYMSLLYTNPEGISLLKVVGGLMFFGIIVMYRMVKIKV
ncbi:type II secretion system F family protein [Halodesulfovibrio marinisediminis]|uniref:Tight adherence protein B n=1 Tax=Halodesulfovibrio marinisediminis DSM 17456 TaxID=1121457 RepID=A0A1N6EA30_9BACT|nr:type II secretion system F family protein [Halodesulfovibrio marinisediminis]SIN79892.1 tight adherence protein B [Halodesulfovibrio marinisediminis DSM 17456]